MKLIAKGVRLLNADKPTERIATIERAPHLGAGFDTKDELCRFAQRLTDCHNALTGVADPANAIAAARDALLAAAQDLVASHIVDNVLQERKGQKPFPEPASLAKVRAALALLEGVQP